MAWIRLLAHYLLMRPAIFLLGWPRIIGREHLKNVPGPLLVISNHLGDVDPGFILTALPERFRHRLAIATGGEALEALRTPAAERGSLLRVFDQIKWVLGVSLLNLFPLPREAGLRCPRYFQGITTELEKYRRENSGGSRRPRSSRSHYERRYAYRDLNT